MLAKKLNRVYNINEQEKDAYLKRGFDIVNEKGEVIEASPDKTITYAEHNKIVAELKAELEKANDVPKNAKELKAVNEELTKANEELTAAKEALEAEVAELKAQVEALTQVGGNDGKVQE